MGECITSQDECPINGIMKLHSLVAQDNKVILLPWSFTNCTLSVICHKCKGRKEFVKPRDVSLVNSDGSVPKDKIELQDADGKGQTDVASDDDSSGDEDEGDDNITAIDVLWGNVWQNVVSCQSL